MECPLFCRSLGPKNECNNSFLDSSLFFPLFTGISIIILWDIKLLKDLWTKVALPWQNSRIWREDITSFNDDCPFSARNLNIHCFFEKNRKKKKEEFSLEVFCLANIATYFCGLVEVSADESAAETNANAFHGCFVAVYTSDERGVMKSNFWETERFFVRVWSATKRPASLY